VGGVLSGLLRFLLVSVLFVRTVLRRTAAREAELLFLRHQLALYRERRVPRRRLRPGDRLLLSLLGRLFNWREALLVVRPETFIRWHRRGFKLFWRWTCSRGGRPPLPEALRALIAEMSHDNPSWGEERIASELRLKLGLRVSPRTVARYVPKRPHGREHRHSDQRWTTFVRNHAETIVACDFFTSVTATFRVLYVFLVMEVGSRRILHYNVTANPTAEWTTRQLREAIPHDHRWRFLVHDRDSIFSRRLDETINRMGLRVLKSPIRAPKANAFVERLIGTMRRECLDWLIPLSENHLRRILGRWVRHYNQARPHASLGPGIPEPPKGLPVLLQAHRHRIPPGDRVVATPILGGLHHEYRLDRAA
jgi:transposase InsO family protein